MARLTGQPTGRPTAYTESLGDDICEQLMDGKSLREICRADDMPARSTVIRWSSHIDGFSAQYEKSRAEQANALADDILSIADNDTTDADVQRDRLRVDARKWVASKMMPKRYGDKLQTEHSGSIDLNNLSDEELQAKLRQAQSELKQSTAD